MINSHNTDTTIAAISTPVTSAGGISIIRISGKDAIEVADKIFVSPSGKRLADAKSHTIHYGYVVGLRQGAGTPNVRQRDGSVSRQRDGSVSRQRDGSVSARQGTVLVSDFVRHRTVPLSGRHENRPLSDGERIDEVLVSVMRAPRTFTAEDTVEINCHGGMYVTKRILEEVIKAGAVPAAPGEFTKRAFMNGRIDLAQAEGVIDVINAENDFALKSSVGQISGRLSSIIKEIRGGILDHCAYMEAAMDDPEHISMDGHTESMRKDISRYIRECDALLKGFNEGKLLREGIPTCIVGRTNAGKSSLLNLLTGEESAIVTDIEGTTRDTLSESVRLGDMILNLTDTAGIRKTDDKVEEIGIKKALESAKKAVLIIFMIDSTKDISDEDKEIFLKVCHKPTIILLNKCDLKSGFDQSEVNVTFTELAKSAGSKYLPAVLDFSTVTGEGLEELEREIEGIFNLNDIISNDAPVSVNVRHKALLESAKKSLLLVDEGIEGGASEDLLCVDLMDAYASLGLIIGEEIEDDLADRIFEKFCMGK